MKKEIQRTPWCKSHRKMWLSPQPETPVWGRLASNEAPGEAPNEASDEVSDEPRAWPHNAAAAGVSAGEPGIVLAERRALGKVVCRLLSAEVAAAGRCSAL